MSDEEFNQGNRISENESQTVKKSELLPIYENMGFAGDIQPLADIEIPDEIKLTYSGKKSDVRSENKPFGLKKFDFNILKRLTSVPRIILSAVVVLAVIGGIIGLVNFALKKADGNSSAIISVYSTSNNSAVMFFSNNTTREIPSAQKTYVSNDGRYLYYAKSTASRTGKYDLYVVDSSSKKSVKNGGKFIEIGVDEGWQITADGKYACYGISERNDTLYYLFDVENGKSELISDSVKQAFLPYAGDIVYFTHGDGNNHSLQCKQMGEKAELIANNVSYVKMAKSEEGFEILYTVPSGQSLNVDIWMTDGVSEPKLICKNASEVYMDNYVYGGNLYYFIKSSSNVNWQDFIEDNYFDDDASMEKPVEGDYMVERGFIFKRYVLDQNAYNKALNNYNEKMIRDTIRSAVDDIDLGLATKDEYSCYVYSNQKSTKLVNGVTLDNIIDFADKGEPRIIYRKSTIGVDNKISMDKLVSVTKSEGIDGAVDYINEVVSDSYELSNICNYAWYDSNKVISYEIKDYKLDKTYFSFSNRNTMFAVCDNNLYCNEISSLELSKKNLVDNGIEDEVTDGDFIYYLKSESDGVKTLYRYSLSNGKEKIIDNVYSYFISGKNVIVMTKNPENDTVDVGFFDSSSYKTVDMDISLDKFLYSEKSFSYMKNYSGNTGGDLYINSFSDDVRKIAVNAVDILFTE